MVEKSRHELIEQLKRIRVKITKIYMKLGNPEKVKADSILREEIIMFEKANDDSKKV